MARRNLTIVESIKVMDLVDRDVNGARNILIKGLTALGANLPPKRKRDIVKGS